MDTKKYTWKYFRPSRQLTGVIASDQSSHADIIQEELALYRQVKAVLHGRTEDNNGNCSPVRVDFHKIPHSSSASGSFCLTVKNVDESECIQLLGEGAFTALETPVVPSTGVTMRG